MVPGRDRRFTMRLPSHIGTSDSPVTRQPGSKRSTLNRLCKKAYPFNAPCSRQLARELPLWNPPIELRVRRATGTEQRATVPDVWKRPFGRVRDEGRGRTRCEVNFSRRRWQTGHHDPSAIDHPPNLCKEKKQRWSGRRPVRFVCDRAHRRHPDKPLPATFMHRYQTPFPHLRRQS